MYRVYCYLVSIILVSAVGYRARPQQPEHVKADSGMVMNLLRRAEAVYFIRPDSSLLLSEEALTISRKIQFTKGEVIALNNAGESLRFTGDYPRALKMQFEALELNRRMKDLAGEARSLCFIGFTYVEFGEYRIALDYLQQARNHYKRLPPDVMYTFNLSNIGNAYHFLNLQDSALYYQEKALESYTALQLSHPSLKSMIYTRLGTAYLNNDQPRKALAYYHLSLQNALLSGDKMNESKVLGKLAEFYEAGRQYDSSLFYARQSFAYSRISAQNLQVLDASKLLGRLFQKFQQADSAMFYKETAMAMKDSLYGPEKIRQLQVLLLEEQAKEQKNKAEQEQLRNRIRTTILLAVLVIFLLISFILFRSNRIKQRTNSMLNQQKNKIEETLSELRATQQQLIQSEKMASLGELTAGIAHEIQNPLNFVNNFSELSHELLDEMQEELSRGNLNEALSIAGDVKQNLEKITQHGKRADAIVKGMLQHSRSSNGQKEFISINALADEYLRLAYHGLRAKDKSFNAKFETDFDDRIGEVNLVPQEIGRVLLNLINNAFYAVTERKKQAEDGYEPVVSVSTRKVGNTIEIAVKDNGTGIPPRVLEKIFQPFFTTKPAGQGTGLGLSLSYDLITKGHGGELNVKTKEGEGTEFLIVLPVK